MKIPIFAPVAFALALASCSDAVSGPTTAVPAHGVLMTVTVPGPCLLSCDPPSGEATRVALVRLVNTGNARAYLVACGPMPAVGEQQLLNGEWVNIGPAVACVYPSTPIPLAAGDSLRFNYFFAPGTRRLVLSVASDSTLKDEVLDASASVVIR